MTVPTATGASLRRDLQPLAPGAIVLVIWLVWIGASGGYAPETWYPSALVMLSLWMVVVAGGRRILPSTRIGRAALLAFAGLVALNYLSILWAGSAGDALQSANQLALYLVGAWIFALLPWTPRALSVLLGLWSVGIAAFCAVRLAQASAAPALTAFFVNQRFSLPMDYSNATAALAVMGMWPALILSARRELPWWLRGLGLGVAAFLADFSTLPQSRAALIGLIATAVVALIAGPGRLRLLWRMAIVGGTLAVCLPRTVAVNDAVTSGGDVTPIFQHASAVILLASLAALVVGLGLGTVEGRLALRRRSRGPAGRIPHGSRVTRRTAIVGATATAVAVVAVAVVVAGPTMSHLVHGVIQKGNTDASTGSNRLLSASPEERFDYARVAVHLFSGAPILGIGAGNFGRRYDALRRFVKHSQYTHNLPLRVLAETGVVGAILFVAFLALLVVGMVRASRRGDGLARGCAAIALCVSGYFLVHSCLDWVDQFPALAVPAIGLPLAVIELAGPAARSRTQPSRGPGGAVRLPAALRRGLPVGAGAAMAIWLVIALGASYVSLRYVDQAFAVARSSPQQGFHDLSMAHSLNPLSADPLTSEGTIALYRHELSRSQRAFTASVRKEDDWYPRMELALIADHQGRFAAALAQLAATARLDADDPLVARARRMARERRRIDPIRFNQQVLQEGDVTSAAQPVIR